MKRGGYFEHFVMKFVMPGQGRVGGLALMYPLSKSNSSGSGGGRLNSSCTTTTTSSGTTTQQHEKTSSVYTENWIFDFLVPICFSTLPLSLLSSRSQYKKGEKRIHFWKGRTKRSFVWWEKWSYLWLPKGITVRNQDIPKNVFSPPFFLLTPQKMCFMHILAFVALVSAELRIAQLIQIVHSSYSVSGVCQHCRGLFLLEQTQFLDRTHAELWWHNCRYFSIRCVGTVAINPLATHCVQC